MARSASETAGLCDDLHEQQCLVASLTQRCAELGAALEEKKEHLAGLQTELLRLRLEGADGETSLDVGLSESLGLEEPALGGATPTTSSANGGLVGGWSVSEAVLNGLHRSCTASVGICCCGLPLASASTPVTPRTSMGLLAVVGSAADPSRSITPTPSSAALASTPDKLSPRRKGIVPGQAALVPATPSSGVVSPSRRESSKSSATTLPSVSSSGHAQPTATPAAGTSPTGPHSAKSTVTVTPASPTQLSSPTQTPSPAQPIQATSTAATSVVTGPTRARPNKSRSSQPTTRTTDIPDPATPSTTHFQSTATVLESNGAHTPDTAVVPNPELSNHTTTPLLIAAATHNPISTRTAPSSPSPSKAPLGTSALSTTAATPPKDPITLKDTAAPGRSLALVGQHPRFLQAAIVCVMLR